MKGLSRGPALLAFAWGFAEATFFFFVPDVVLSFLALRGVPMALRASVAALLGALIGGAAMYAWGSAAAPSARAFLTYIPGIHADLVSSVNGQIAAEGWLAVLLGPVRGTPYKIYAIEWGAAHGSLLTFLAVSVPARYIRFLGSTLLAGAFRQWLRPWFLALLWIVFYAFYFAKFGW